MKNNQKIFAFISVIISCVLLAFMLFVSKDNNQPTSINQAVSINASGSFITDTDNNNNIVSASSQSGNALPLNNESQFDSDTEASANNISDNAITTSQDTSFNDIDSTPTYVDITQCSSGTVLDAASINLDDLDNYFVITEISDDILSYIDGKSYRENNNISLSELRYIKLIHYNYNHDIQVGELIVNESAADEFVDIFKELFISEYEIEKMYLPDRYWTGDCYTTDDASCDDNNTSAFFYRTVESTGNISNHAYGLAIDINPQQNPYVRFQNGSPICAHENAMDYLDRSSGAEHMITKDDLCYQLFISHGFSWGGSWTHSKDYQHFEKR